MSLRNNRIDIPEGPGWTDVLRTKNAAGDDGLLGVSDVLVTCAADSENPVEYRVEKPADPVGDAGTLQPGEAVRLRGGRQLIDHIVMRGVDGDAIGGVENLTV